MNTKVVMEAAKKGDKLAVAIIDSAAIILILV